MANMRVFLACAVPMHMCMLHATFAAAHQAQEIAPGFPRGVSAARRSAQCDQYCNDEANPYCTPSPLASTAVLYDKPEMFSGDATTYAKCHYPWKGNGRDHPIRCPPAVTQAPQECEQCGWSSGSATAASLPGTGDAPWSTMEECCPSYTNDKGFRYLYDYAWNRAKGEKGAYKHKDGGCWGWWGCKDGYSCRGRSWWGKGTCELDTSRTRFLGESCDNSDQCNGATAEHVDMVCSAYSKKCMLSEDAGQEHHDGQHTRKQCSCSIFDHGDALSFFTGLLSCKNYKDCGGNYCDRTTADMNMYCKPTKAWHSKCSNCRASNEPCKP